MRMILSGYGEGPFTTLRGQFEVTKETVSVDKTAIISSDGYGDAGLVI
jgi:hypothetical protein